MERARHLTSPHRRAHRGPHPAAMGRGGFYEVQMDAQPVAAHPNLSRLPPLEVRLWARPERLRSELYFLAARGDARTLSERLALSGGAGGRLDLAWSDMGKGRTALWVAAYYGEEACVRLLVEAGAPVDQPNVNGATPLWVACQGGYDGVASLLLAWRSRIAAAVALACCCHHARRVLQSHG